MNNTPIAARARRNMILSTAGSFFFIQIAATGSVFMTSFILFLGGDATDIGRLAGIPQLMGVLQLFSVLLYRRFRSRKKVVLALGIAKYLFFYTMFLVPWLPQQIRISSLMAILISGFAIQALAGAGSTEWNDFFVPPDMKGRYYSNRNLTANASGIIVAIIVGQILTWAGETLMAFLLILGVSLIFSVMEIILLTSVPDVTEGLDKPSGNRFTLMLSPLKDPPYKRFIVFSAMWHFGLLLGQPYLNYYAIKQLGLTIAVITGIASAVSFAKLLSARAWGNSVDRWGGRNILIATGFLYAGSYGCWAFIQPNEPIFYGFVALLAGMSMIGTNIAIFNMNILLSPSNNRVSYFGVNGALSGIVGYSAPSIGAFLLEQFNDQTVFLTAWGLNPYSILFLLSSACMIAALTYFVSYKGFRKPA